MEIVLYLLTSSIVILIGSLFYRFLRSIRANFAVTVNCWFCGENTKVPLGNKNCWDCPKCEQYNGFTKDGDYNKPIPSQHVEELNHPVSADQGSGYKQSSSSLCEACNRNQLLKVKQLACFVPYNEVNFDMEVAQYKQHLEQVYRLCHPCNLKLAKVLTEQDERLWSDYEDKLLSSSPGVSRDVSMDTSLQDSMCSSHLLCQLSAPMHVRLLRATSSICAIVLAVSAVATLLHHSDVGLAVMPYMVQEYFENLYHMSGLTVLLGFTAHLLAIISFGKNGIHKCDGVGVASWLLSVSLYSAWVEHRLPAQDRFLLQSMVDMATSSVCLWSMFCTRYEKTSSTKRFIKKRSNRSFSASPNDSRNVCGRPSQSPYSVHNSTSHSPSQSSNRAANQSIRHSRNQSVIKHQSISQETPLSSNGGAFNEPLGLFSNAAGTSVRNAETESHCGRLQSLRIGSAATHRSHGPMFSSSSQHPPSPYSGRPPVFASQGRQNRQQPLVSPARFRPLQSRKSTGSPRVNLFSKPGHRIYERSEWFNDVPASLSEGVPSDGGSLFSEPRHPQGDTITDDDDSAPSRRAKERRPPGQRTRDSESVGDDGHSEAPPSCMARISGLGLGSSNGQQVEEDDEQQVEEESQGDAQNRDSEMLHSPSHRHKPSRPRPLWQQMVLGIGLGVFIGAFLIFFLDMNLISYLGRQHFFQHIVTYGFNAAQNCIRYVSDKVDFSRFSTDAVLDFFDIEWNTEDS